MKKNEDTVDKKDVFSWVLLIALTLAFFLLLASTTREFMLAIFGWAAYVCFPMLIFMQLLFVVGYRINVPKKRVVLYALFFIFAILAIHIMLAKELIVSDNSYIKETWNGFGTVAGVVGCLLTAPIIWLCGGYAISLVIFFVIASALGLFILYPHIVTLFAKENKQPAKAVIKKNPTPTKLDEELNYNGLNVQDVNAASAETNSKAKAESYGDTFADAGTPFGGVLFGAIKTKEALINEQQQASMNELSGKQNKSMAFPDVFGNSFGFGNPLENKVADHDYYPEQQDTMKEQREIINRHFVDLEDTHSSDTSSSPFQAYVNNFSNETAAKTDTATTAHMPKVEAEVSYFDRSGAGADLTTQVESFHEAVENVAGMRTYTEEEASGYTSLFSGMIRDSDDDGNNGDDDIAEYPHNYEEDNYPSSTSDAIEVEEPKNYQPPIVERHIVEEKVEKIIPINKPIKPRIDNTEVVTLLKEKAPYKVPPLSLLETNTSAQSSFPMNFNEMKIKIENILKELGIAGTVYDAVQGSAFTRYEIKLGAGVGPAKVTSHESTIQMRLKISTLNILAPIPGKDAIGFEIENAERSTVGLRSVICSKEFSTMGRDKLPIPVGQTIDAKPFVANLATMPHLLVAGATGKGKSVFINSLIIGLLFNCSPEEVRLLLIDPKRVETGSYEGLPHLLTRESVKEPEEAERSIKWLVEEMDERYKILQEVGCRNIIKYNEIMKANGGQTMFRIVLILDEMSDLMGRSTKDAEKYIVRLAQLGRASGIHLVLATQRPTVDVITGLIKANITNRVAFTVNNKRDSNIIIDRSGADKLLGYGDLLFGGDAPYVRMQGCFVSDEEIDNVCDYVRENNVAEFDEKIAQYIADCKGEPETIEEVDKIKMKNDEWEDKNADIIKQVLNIFITNNRASTSMIQSAFGFGYPRASRIMAYLEKKGYVKSDPEQVSKSKELNITIEEYNAMYGEE